LASAKTTKKAVTGRNRRRRLARFKIVKQKSQEGQKKRMLIQTKKLPLHTTNNQLSTTHYFNTSTISPSPLSVLLTGLLSRSLPELLLVDIVSERLGLLLLVLVGLRTPVDICSMSLRSEKFEGVVDMDLDGWADPLDLCHVARSSVFLASPDRMSSNPSSQLFSSRTNLSRLGDK
jgi:hypothetical protein